MFFFNVQILRKRQNSIFQTFLGCFVSGTSRPPYAGLFPKSRKVGADIELGSVSCCFAGTFDRHSLHQRLPLRALVSHLESWKELKPLRSWSGPSLSSPPGRRLANLPRKWSWSKERFLSLPVVATHADAVCLVFFLLLLCLLIFAMFLYVLLSLGHERSRSSFGCRELRFVLKSVYLWVVCTESWAVCVCVAFWLKHSC